MTLNYLILKSKKSVFTSLKSWSSYPFVVFAVVVVVVVVRCWSSSLICLGNEISDLGWSKKSTESYPAGADIGLGGL